MIRNLLFSCIIRKNLDLCNTICLLRVSLQNKIEDFGPLEIDEIPIGEISKQPLCLQIPR